MKKVLLLCLLALVLAFAAEGWALTVSLKESSGNLSKGEGDLFEFATETAGTSGPVSFEWDFGDNSGIFATNEPSATHNYYFDAKSGETKRAFKVSVKAGDGSGESQASIDINVEKAKLKAKLRSPGQSQRLQKGSTIRIEIEALNLTNVPINTANVSLAKASINGIPVNLAKEGTFFSGTVASGHSFGNIETIEVEVQSGIVKASQKLSLFFLPSEISVKANPIAGKEPYFGSPVGKIEAVLQLPDGSTPSGGDFTARIVSNGKELEQKKMERSQAGFAADIAYILTAEDYLAGTTLKISGRDSSGNILTEQSFQAALKKDNPLFNIRLDSPEPKQKEPLKAGQAVLVSASFESASNAENAKMWVFLPASKKTQELSGEDGIFSGEINIPDSGGSKILLFVYGTAKVQGTSVGDFEEAEFDVARELAVSFVYPAAGQVQQQGDGKTIIVSISLPSGQPPGKSSYQGGLYVDGEKQNVVLNRGKEKNQYTITLNEALFGKHSLKLVLSNVDGLKGSAEISTEISQSFDWFGLALLAIVIIALAFLGNFVRSQFREGRAVKSGPAKPKTKKELIRDEKKKLEIEFYKRRISEEEFRERMIELQKSEKELAVQQEDRDISEIIIAPQKSESRSKPAMPGLFGKPKEEPKQEEDHARQVIEKRLEAEDALSPLIIGRDFEKPKAAVPQKPNRIIVEEALPAQKTAEPKKPGQKNIMVEEFEPTQKTKISAKKTENIEEKLEAYLRQGPLSLKEEEAVNELVFALKPKAFAYTRREIFESLVNEGFSERIAAEAVKRIFG